MFVYNCDYFCNDCGNDIVDELNRDGIEDTVDTNEYPQFSGNTEADYPIHCADCGECLGNSLTDDGVAYVIETYRNDIAAGRLDSVACAEWAEVYWWIDFPDWGSCDLCGKEGFLDCYNECEDGCEYGH